MRRKPHTLTGSWVMPAAVPMGYCGILGHMGWRRGPGADGAGGLEVSSRQSPQTQVM